jgi:hypothetical protein
MDPERKWISRLEPETPETDEDPDESPLRRVYGVAVGVVVAAGGTAKALALLDVDPQELRLAAVIVVGVIVGAVESAWRRRRSPRRLAES